MRGGCKKKYLFWVKSTKDKLLDLEILSLTVFLALFISRSIGLALLDNLGNAICSIGGICHLFVGRFVIIRIERLHELLKGCLFSGLLALSRVAWASISLLLFAIVLTVIGVATAADQSLHVVLIIRIIIIILLNWLADDLQCSPGMGRNSSVLIDLGDLTWVNGSHSNTELRV